MSPFHRAAVRMNWAMACVSSGINAGTLTGRSDPEMRSAGGPPDLRWISEAPFFTAAASSWLKVLCSIYPPALARASASLAFALRRRSESAAQKHL